MLGCVCDCSCGLRVKCDCIKIANDRGRLAGVPQEYKVQNACCFIYVNNKHALNTVQLVC